MVPSVHETIVCSTHPAVAHRCSSAPFTRAVAEIAALAMACAGLMGLDLRDARFKWWKVKVRRCTKKSSIYIYICV